MNRFALALFWSVAASAAQAHTSLVPHEHPHDASSLPGLDEFVLAILLAGVVLLALGKFRRTFASSFRGAGTAREPGIQKQSQSKPLDSGSGPSGRPGMTGRERP